MAARSRPRGRRSRSRGGTTDPAGAAVPEPRVRRRAGAERDEAEPLAPPPAEVVHVIPADHLDVEDLSGMSLPIGIGDSAHAVRLPGDSVLTVPDESDIPAGDELDERDARKGTRRKRTGPKAPASTRPDPDAPADTAPPPTEPESADPGRVDPHPADPDSHDHDSHDHD